jgi:hypothetical protein
MSFINLYSPLTKKMIHTSTCAVMMSMLMSVKVKICLKNDSDVVFIFYYSINGRFYAVSAMPP